jgi:molybdopterin-guanine dinucleotide biosynthesis protein MobB
MKIIQIAGRSNSGKTTFIRKLIPELKKLGRVGVIKHLGDHEYRLETGKDTTLFYEAGADIATGIDANKSVSVFSHTNLDVILRFFADSGILFTVIEGYKHRSFTKIVIGSLEIDRCIMTNPTTDEVIQSLHLFDDYK